MAAPDYDVIIAGAGLVGASLAGALARSPELAGARMLLVEPGPAPTPPSGTDYDPRVVALTRHSEQLLTDMGAWDGVLARRACAYTDMHVWDGEGTASIHFASSDFHEPNLGHIVENSVVLNAVLEMLADRPRVTVARGQRVQALDPTDTHVQLNDGRWLSAELVVAADGAKSPLRELLGIPVRAKSHRQRAIVTTVRTAEPHRHTAWQRFMRTGPLAFLPLAEGDGHYSSIVWSLDQDAAASTMALDDTAFKAALGEAFEFYLGKIQEVAKRYSFPLGQSHAERYFRPGFALVGDAAHTIHPLAGQGVNLGLLDAAALVAELQRARRRGLPLGHESVLGRYQRARKGANLGMMALMDGFKQLFGSTQPLVHVARNLGMERLDSLPALKNALARRAMGMSVASR